MAKKKVFQLAKDQNMSSAALLQMLKELGHDLKSHMSVVDDEMQQAVAARFAKQREEIKLEYARKSKLIVQQRVNDDIVIAEDEKIKKTTQAVFTNFAALAGKKAKKKKKKGRQAPVDQTQIKENVRKVLTKIGAGDRTRKRYKRDEAGEEDESGEAKKKLMVSEFVSVAELAKNMEKSSSEVMSKCLELGMMVTINQRLDFELISLLAEEFDFEAELMKEFSTETIMGIEEEIQTGEAFPRPPVVTVMGHVDHGKTSLLDHIRETNVIDSESGGITQHIGAYVVNTAKGPVTFLDTPGHAAFTAMRARGAQVTDVVVLIVAADGGVMPQTIEAIDHAKAANVPIVVAVNKIDLPTSKIDQIKNQLSQHNVIVEDYGGAVQCIPISAKTGENVNKLLELLALETEMLELKAHPQARARGVIVEAELNKGMGPMATVLVQNGTLRVGDPFIVGIHSGRVRTMLNEFGKPVKEVGPGVPARVLGLDGVPQSGDNLVVMDNEKEAREIAAKRRAAKHESDIRQISVTLDNWHSQIKSGALQELNLIIKGDVDGSVEALSAQLEQLSNEEVKIRVIHKNVGAITESDIDLASASKAIIVGFHVRPNSKIREDAKNEGVEIRLYKVIYEAVEEMTKAMEGMLAPLEKENVLGRAEIRQVFRSSKFGVIAGCGVQSGTIKRNATIRVIRDDIEIAESPIASLRRVKDDVREVNAGLECGIRLENYNDIKVGDILEAFEIEKVSRSL